MIHFVPDSRDCIPVEATPYAEAVTRLASLRQVLHLIEGCEKRLDHPADDAVAVAWAGASDARRARFDDRSERIVSGSAAGIEAVATLRAHDGNAHPAAMTQLTGDIRARLDELGTLFSL